MNRFDFKSLFILEGVTMYVETRTKGWHEAGRFSGPPERCYEDEGERETEIVKITLTIGSHEIVLPDTELPGLFERLVGYIQEDAEADAEAILERHWNRLVAEGKFEDDAARADGLREEPT